MRLGRRREHPWDRQNFRLRVRSGSVRVSLRDADQTARRSAAGTVENVSSCLEADARFAWDVANRWKLTLERDNLLHNRHLEVNDPTTTPPRDIQRAVLVSLHTGF